MAVEMVRFDEVADEGDPSGEDYHGFTLTYTEPGYRVVARYYEHSPDRVTVYLLADPPRQGFGEEIPYEDPRLGRAARELLASVDATRLILLDRGVDGASVEVDPAALAGFASGDIAAH